MLGRLAATTARRAAFSAPTLRQLPRAAATASPLRSLHAGVPTRSSEPAATAPADGVGVVGILGKLMGDWKFAVPAGIVLGVPAFHLEIVQLSEESLLVACFMTFVAVCYTQAGDMVHKSLAEKKAAVEAEFRAMEASRAVKLEEQIKALTLQATLLDDMKNVYAIQDGLMAKMAATKTMELQHAMYRDAVARLEAIVSTETRATTALQQAVISAACADAEQSVQDPAARFVFDKLALYSVTGAFGDLSKAPAGIADPGQTVEAALKDAAAAKYDVVASIFDDYFETVRATASTPGAGQLSVAEREAVYAEYVASIKPPALPDMVHGWATGLDNAEDLAMPMPKA